MIRHSLDGGDIILFLHGMILQDAGRAYKLSLRE